MIHDDKVANDDDSKRTHKRRKVDDEHNFDHHQEKKKKGGDGATLTDDPKNNSNNNQLSKKQRRRLKKLLKRASSVDTSAQFSGITSASDWEELKRWLPLAHNNNNNDKVPHVSIHWRKDDKHGNKQQPVVVDANTHRLLLLRLLQTATGTRKKAVDHDSSSTYACFSIHNPAVVNHVGVIEVHVTDQNDMEKLRDRLFSNRANDLPVAVSSSTTLWFQKNGQQKQQQLQSISDAFMYKMDDRKTSKENGDDAPAAVSSLTDLIERMEPLLLTPKQMQQEGYPVRSSDKVVPERKREKEEPLFSWTSTRPQDIPFEEACKFIQAFQVTPPPSPSDDERILPPYVAHHQHQPQQQEELTAARRVFAMDCEMVETCTGLELARVTLCQLKTFTAENNDNDIETELVFDALVRPSNAVTDYKTVYSGMTAELLNDKSNKDIVVIQQVQASLLLTIRRNDIVIGHSLENDLQATRWIHDTVIDTSVLFRPVRRSFKYSLRHLAAVLLKIQIQRPDKPHCSEEDAVTALRLAVGRVVKGASFCIYEKPSPSNILTELSARKATIACMGTSDWLQRHVLSGPSNSIHALRCDSVSDYNAKAISSWMAVNAVWAHFRLQDEADIDQLDNLVKDVALNLQPRAVLMVAIQSGYEKADGLTKMRAVRQKPKATIPWSDSEEEEWSQVVENCRRGCVFWISGQRPPE